MKGVQVMYNKQKYRPMNHMSQFEQSGSPIPTKRKQRKGKIFRKSAAFVLSAVIFGGLAGGSFYGVNALLGYTESAVAENQAAEQDCAVSLSALSYISETTSQSLDVSGVAVQGLSSVVSVTNISVQEVQNYFGQFGRNGRGQTQLQETTSCGSGVIVYSGDSELYMVTNYHWIGNGRKAGNHSR